MPSRRALQFPPPDTADSHGLIGVSEFINPPSILNAYAQGIFPWPIEGIEGIPWFSPPQRALLFLDELHVSRRLARTRRSSELSIRLNTDTAEVIRSCARSANRKDSATWITEDLASSYAELADSGFCYSVEAFKGRQLVGGMYGVAIDTMCSGESMFYLETDASKLCLLHLFELLEDMGVSWFDCQQLTPLMQSFGARELERKRFLDLLRPSVQRMAPLFPR